MKHKISTSLLTLVIMSSILGACSPADTNPTSTTQPVVEAKVEVKLSGEDLKVKVNEVMKKAFNDEDFKNELNADPKAVLANEGLVVDDGDKVKILEYTADSVYMILDDRNLQEFYPQLAKPSSTEQNKVQTLLTAIRTKAKTDSAFKAKLLSDSAATLESEGINAESSKNFKVQDYDANTHFFIVLPPEQALTRNGDPLDRFNAFLQPPTTAVYDFFVNIISTIARGIGTPLSELALQGSGAVHDAGIDYATHQYPTDLGNITTATHYAIEGMCYVPRNWFGDAGCQATEPQLRKYFDDEFRKTEYLGFFIKKVH